jgi:hypothetical protein
MEEHDTYYHGDREAVKTEARLSPFALAYIEVLEDVAEAALQYSHNSMPSHLLALNEALAKVDWMRK